MKYLWLLLLAATAFGQNIRYDNIALGPKGPIPNAQIAVCFQPATVSTTPCTPLAPLCASLTDASCTQPNPFFADQSGNFHFYIQQGPVTIQIYGPGVQTPFVQTDQLSGVGQNAVVGILVSPSTINFGTVQTSISSSPQSIVILNTGSVVLLVSSVSIAGNADFSSSNLAACNGSISPGTSCVIAVRFLPTAVGTETATVTVNTTATCSNQQPTCNQVSLTGTGVASGTDTVSVSCGGTGDGTVQSDETPPLINVSCSNGVASGTSSGPYAPGATPTLSALALNGGTFSGFAGGGCSTSPCTLAALTGNVAVTASFNAPATTVALSIAATGQGSGNIISDTNTTTDGPLGCNAVSGVVSSSGNSGCSGGFLAGTTVTLTATANAGSTFVGWSGPCTGSGTCVITINSDVTATANFTTTAVPISLVQTTDNCSVSGSTIACTWGNAQLAGDTNICVVGWPDATSTVSSIADTSLNTYTQVPTISPKVGTGLTQAVYYSQNIAAANAGANTTTATLSAGVSAVSFTNLTAGSSNVQGSSISTASVTPSANQPVMLAVDAFLNSGNGAGAVSSVTGNGLTWVKVKAQPHNAALGTGHISEFEVWCGSAASPSAGAITVNYGTTPTHFSWSVSQASNAASGCANAIGISAANGVFSPAASPLTVTMGTFGSSANGTYAAGGVDGTRTITAGTSFTLLGTSANTSSTGDEFATGNVSPATLNYIGSGSNDWAIVGVEIKVPQNRRDMRCLEYSGLGTGGVDTSVAAIGTSAAPSSGALPATTQANDVVVGAVMASTGGVLTASSGYTQRVKNSFGDDAEDIEGAASGASPTFAPTLSASANWVAQNVSFKASGGTAPTNASITIVPSGNGFGTVISNVGNPQINATISPTGCSGVCSTSVTVGTSVTFTATASAGSQFVAFNGTGCSTVTPCTSTISTNTTLSVGFNLTGTLNYYVNPSTGNDSRTAAQAQNPSTPWATPNHAMGNMQIGAGGTILHLAGGQTYSSTLACPLGTGTANICFTQGGTSNTQRLRVQCDAYQTCQMNPGNGSGNAAVSICGAKFIDVAGLITGPNAAQGLGIHVTGGSCGTPTSIHILGNKVINIASTVNDGQGGGVGCPKAGAILAPAGFDMQYIGNVINGYGVAPGTGCNFSHGIYAGGGGSTSPWWAVIEDNLISNAANTGIQIYSSPCNTYIANNTVFHNQVGVQLSGSNCPTPGSNIIDNNIVDNNTQANFAESFSGSGADCTSATPTSYSNNINNGSPAAHVGLGACDSVSGEITTEAATTTFTNYLNNGLGTYTLANGSKAIGGGRSQSITFVAGATGCNAGTGVVCLPSKDIEGFTSANPIDIGAFAFGSTQQTWPWF